MHALLLAAVLAAPSFVIGETVRDTMISVCAKQEDAMRVIEGDSMAGKEEANKRFDEFDSCNNVPVDFVVGPVLLALEIPSGKVAKVVEIHDPEGSDAKLYWLTTLEILEKKKPERAI